MKALLKKAMVANKSTSKEGHKLTMPTDSSLAVNEVAHQQPLIDAEEEGLRELKFKNDHVEYLRMTKKPLQFGIEEALTYQGHQHMRIQGCLQNFNNK